MIEREVAARFLNKIVGVVRNDNGTSMFSRGKIIEVTDTCIILEFYGKEQAIALAAIENLREIA